MDRPLGRKIVAVSGSSTVFINKGFTSHKSDHIGDFEKVVETIELLVYENTI